MGLVRDGPIESCSHKNDILVIINDYSLEMGLCYVPLHHSSAVVGRSGWQITWGVASISFSTQYLSTVSDILRQGVDSLAQ